MKIFLSIISLFLLPSLVVAQQQNPYLAGLYRSLSEATSDTAQMEAYRKLGLYYILEDRDSSGSYLEKALPIAVRLNLKLEEASILNGMGVLQMQQEKFSKSFEFYLRAINIAKDPAAEKSIWRLTPGLTPASERLLVLSSSYDLIGLLNAYSGNWIDNINNQLKNYREAEKYAKEAGDSLQMAYITFHIGIAYMNSGKLDSALKYIVDAQQVLTDFKDPVLGRTMIYEGETYQRMGKYDVASQTILKAIALLNDTNDHLHQGLANLAVSRVYMDVNQFDSALHHAKESYNIFARRKDEAWKRDASNLLASCYERLGNTDSATVYLKLAKTLTDSLSVEVRKNLLAFQDVVVVEQVKLEKLEKEKIETREKFRIYLLTSGILVVTVIVLLLYRNNRVRKKTNEMLRQRNEQIENTLNQLRSTQAQLIQSEKMASLGELTAGIAHEIQNPLNFVNNFSEINKELLQELQNEAENGNLSEVKAIANDVAANEEKIAYHGQRADMIVKSMLQHSRTRSGQMEPTDINALCEEYLRLAYHGFRAKDKSFNATIHTDFDNGIGKISIIPQDVSRVMLNLINNALYAVHEKNKSGIVGYEPAVTVSTRQNGNDVIISVKDNGNGIPDAIKDKIFQPFYTTKPTGQGTGLGLSLSYDIIQAQGGTLSIASTGSTGTTFSIVLKR